MQRRAPIVVGPVEKLFIGGQIVPGGDGKIIFIRWGEIMMEDSRRAAERKLYGDIDSHNKRAGHRCAPQLTNSPDAETPTDFPKCGHIF